MGSSSLREVLSGGWLSSSRCRCSSLEPAWQAFSTRVGRWRPCYVRRSETNFREVKEIWIAKYLDRADLHSYHFRNCLPHKLSASSEPIRECRRL